MTYVVTEACIDCRYTDCVDVCPVDCFHAGPNFLVIDPDECIDCAVCEAECPVNAIRAEENLQQDQQDWVMTNQQWAKIWPVITRSEPALPDADTWSQVTAKRHRLRH